MPTRALVCIATLFLVEGDVLFARTHSTGCMPAVRELPAAEGPEARQAGPDVICTYLLHRKTCIYVCAFAETCDMFIRCEGITGAASCLHSLTGSTREGQSCQCGFLATTFPSHLRVQRAKYVYVWSVWCGRHISIGKLRMFSAPRPGCEAFV